MCEGLTIETVYSKDFIDLRKVFFDAFYDIELEETKIEEALSKLDNTNDYSEIVLWFKYDLFCHINMVAVISLIQQKKIDLPLYLVCSGRIEGSKNLKGLGELSSEQLLEHYKNKVLLNPSDIDIATTVWGIDHILLKPLIVKPSSFKYLSNCLKAHLERFPYLVDGLNILERNILKIIDKHHVTSINHLLGYALNYQGFYSYGDIQLSRIIDNLEFFYSISDNKITLSRKEHEALLGQHNFSSEINDKMTFGGVKNLVFNFANQKIN